MTRNSWSTFPTQSGATISKGQGVGTIQDDDAPVASTMHVADLDATSMSAPRGKWNAEVTITVQDASGNLVANATVYGDWSNGASGYATTDANGQAVITVSNINKKTRSITFTVTRPEHASLTYEPDANEDEDGDSNGEVIQILKP